MTHPFLDPKKLTFFSHIYDFLCKDLIKKLQKPLDDAISEAKISKKDISEVILVGGSTRLPIIRKFITDFF